jgi:fumarylacetoacetase
LFNDWSARDIQGWESRPLGPFLAKNFASTLSPWVVTLDALAPFRTPFTRPEGDPPPLAYLQSTANSAHGGFDIALEVWLQTPAMRAAGHAGDCVSNANYRDAYWTAAQLVAHHTSGGCNLRAGDLLGTGTVSGPGPQQGGCLMELSAGGQRPLQLSNGETRAWLQDGDTVTLRGQCQQPGFRRIGFGHCSGTVLAAKTALQTA